jgi:sec-independent protein translocase protein TatC
MREERLQEKLKQDQAFQEMMKPVVKVMSVNRQALRQLLREELGLIGLKLENVTVTSPAEEWIPVPVLVNPGEMVELIETVQKAFKEPPTLKIFRVEEGFMVWLKVCLVAGLVVSSPWVFCQIWAFLAAGLYPHEKRIVHYYLPFAISLFLGGILFAQFIVIPQAVHYLLAFTDWLGFEPELRLTEWLGFALLVPLVFGAAFQTPLVMLMLERVGIVSVEGYQKIRRFAILGLTFVAALLAPGDYITMIIMVGCLVLFYEFGIILCKLAPKREWSGLDGPESEGAVEV